MCWHSEFVSFCLHIAAMFLHGVALTVSMIQAENVLLMLIISVTVVDFRDGITVALTYSRKHTETCVHMH